MGGLGLASAADRRDPAWVGSWMQSLAALCAHFPLLADLSSSTPIAGMRSLAHAHARLVAVHDEALDKQAAARAAQHRQRAFVVCQGPDEECIPALP